MPSAAVLRNLPDTCMYMRARARTIRSRRRSCSALDDACIPWPHLPPATECTNASSELLDAMAHIGLRLDKEGLDCALRRSPPWHADVAPVNPEMAAALVLPLGITAGSSSRASGLAVGCCEASL